MTNSSSLPVLGLYTDMDGSLLGKGGSVLRGPDGEFSLQQVGALGVCFKAGVEVVITTGRQRLQAAADTRMLGLSSMIFELGGGVVIDGRESALTAPWQPIGDVYPAEQIIRAGVPEILFERFTGRLEYHDPWHKGRRYTVLMRGLIDATDATEALRRAGFSDLMVRDNGVIHERMARLSEVHAYHVLPSHVSKARAVAFHMQQRGYQRDEVIGFGDSLEDLDLAGVVGRMFVPANGPARDPALAAAIERIPNATVTEGSMGDGFAEVVLSTLAGRGQLG